jgi:GrpB-like predicted nucleotidyltransferase (UPF0157 family)
MNIIIQAYNPEWATEFDRVRKHLLHIFKDIPILSIERVGSTSIPELAAKPILDIGIVFDPKYLQLLQMNYLRRGIINWERCKFQAGLHFVNLDLHVHSQGAESFIKRKKRRHKYIILEGIIALKLCH